MATKGRILNWERWYCEEEEEEEEEEEDDR
jgi:hypothetical protein